MSRIIFSALFFFILTGGETQNLKLEYSDLTEKNLNMNIIDSDFCYSVYQVAKDFHVIKYDKSFQTLDKKTFISQNTAKRKDSYAGWNPYELNYITHNKNTIFVIHSFTFNGTTTYYSLSINKNDLTVTDNIGPIDEHDYPTGQYFFNRKLLTSPDKKKSVFINSIVSGKRRPDDEIRFNFINDNFIKQNTITVDLKMKKNEFFEEEFSIDNTGVFFIAGTERIDAVGLLTGLPQDPESYIRHLFIFSDSGQMLHDIIFDTGRKSWSSFKMLPLKDGKTLLIAGAYKEFPEGMKKPTAKGTFEVKIDISSGKVISSNYTATDNSLLQKSISTSFANYKLAMGKTNEVEEKEIYMDIQIRHLLEIEDGSIYLVYENYSQNSPDYYIKDDYYITGAYAYITYYGDIVVKRMNNSGNMDWVTTIYKLQAALNRSEFASSFNVSYYNNKLYFLFNDNESNLYKNESSNSLYELNIYSKPQTSNKKNEVVSNEKIDFNNHISLVEISEKGEIKKSIIEEKATHLMLTNPSLIFGKEIITYFYDQKKFGFMKGTFE